MIIRPYRYFAVILAVTTTALCAMGLQPNGSALPGLTLKQAKEIEKENSLPIPKLYETLILEGKPGELIAAEECSEYRFPATPELRSKDTGVRAVRFLYHSLSATGHPVPATGVILVPYGRPPKGGWPVVVWAHGTSGVGRAFAPSLMKNLYYGWASPLSWVMLGYAVVAPDYAGLGSRVPHEYLALQAQAQDVIHAIPAARNAVKELGSRWVAIGHSQGGCTVLRVSELQGEIKDANYLGTVAIAPGGDYEPIVEYLHGTQDRGLIGFLAYGIKSVYPDFEYRSFLTPEALEFMPTIQDGGIFVTLTAFAEKVPAGKLLRPEWKKNEYYQKFRMLNVSGEKPAFRQVLLLHGEDDEVIPTNTMDDLHERMKKQKSMVEYKKYPALAHDPLLYGSFRDQVRWVQDRFDSK